MKDKTSAIKGLIEEFLALGELKGGIDPAGADEHWKTARTAIMRISDAFKREGVSPKTFFKCGQFNRPEPCRFYL